MALRSSKDISPEAAEKLAKMNMGQSIRIQQLEAMIKGLIEAQKPLLEEWSKLNKERAEEG